MRDGGRDLRGKDVSRESGEGTRSEHDRDAFLIYTMFGKRKLTRERSGKTQTS